VDISVVYGKIYNFSSKQQSNRFGDKRNPLTVPAGALSACSIDGLLDPDMFVADPDALAEEAVAVGNVRERLHQRDHVEDRDVGREGLG